MSTDHEVRVFLSLSTLPSQLPGKCPPSFTPTKATSGELVYIASRVVWRTTADQGRPSNRAYPALIAAKYTGASIELAAFEIGHAPAELKEKVPYGKIPALVGDGVALFESNAIAYHGAHRACFSLLLVSFLASSRWSTDRSRPADSRLGFDEKPISQNSYPCLRQ